MQLQTAWNLGKNFDGKDRFAVCNGFPIKKDQPSSNLARCFFFLIAPIFLLFVKDCLSIQILI